MSAPAAPANTQTAGRISLPSNDTLNQAAKLSIKVSKPICFYFYIDSCKGAAQIVTADGDKIIYKNSEEHTSQSDTHTKLVNI